MIKTIQKTAVIAAAFAGLSTLASAVQSQALPNADELDAITAPYIKPSYALLKELLSIPSDAHFPDHVAANVKWMTDAFHERKFTTKVLETGGPPLLLAERKVAGADKTVLIYLQIDGQPVDPTKWNQEHPYKPVLKENVNGEWRIIDWDNLDRGFDPEWRVFARAASDAKGPAAMFLTSLDVLNSEGLTLTHNVKVVMDFEEEMGSPHLPAAVAKYKEDLSADMLLIYDGPRHVSNKPTLSFGARGIALISMTTFGPRAPQHSGTYGNFAPNPALRMSQLLASMKDADGRVLIPGFYDGIEFDDETRALINDVPDDEPKILRDMGVRTPEKVSGTYREAVQYPSLSILGLESAWVGAQRRTIIPATATAEMDIRLVKEVDADRLLGLLKDHIRKQGFHFIAGDAPTEEERQSYDRLISFKSRVAYQAFRTPMRSEESRWAEAAMTRAFGFPPIKVRTGGGSIPISPFVVNLKIPAISVPAVYIQNNQHSPNENLRLGNYVEGVKMYLSILTQPF